jgi:hypothetical protein
MSATEVEDAGRDAVLGAVDMKLEVRVIAVSEVSDIWHGPPFPRRAREAQRVLAPVAPIGPRQGLACLVRRLHGGRAGRDGLAYVTGPALTPGCRRRGSGAQRNGECRVEADSVGTAAELRRRRQWSIWSR